MIYLPGELRLDELKIEVSHRCPLECIHCSGDAGESCVREMTLNDCERIIREAHGLGVSKLVLSGGEPLFWESLETVVEQASHFGMYTSIYSSGFVPNIRKKLSVLAELGLNRIIFSLHGAGATVHEWVTRKKGSFDSTLEASKEAISQGLETEFHFVPLKHNYMELQAICELAATLGVKKVSVLRFVPQGRGSNLRRHMLNQLQNIELRNLILTLRKSGYEVRTGSPYNFLRLSNDPHCYSGQDRLIVLPDLRIHPCDAFKQVQAEEIVGTSEYSCLDKFSLKDCWEKSPFLNAVRNHVRESFNEPCISCGYLPCCGSGCVAQKVIEYGKLVHVPDPMCLQDTGGIL
ncbi:radical sam [Lucifera butyrica]|uniref:Radical sam n=1 Tax=Lucifera butyrica TaxID=1351585 RepID=A0A498R9Z6_9FIRM|nr:radical SAM protein [Lucifera butyrica]VBB07102.1 radical sam [Lucifera butyrica]